jgi:hypothetical protein
MKSEVNRSLNEDKVQVEALEQMSEDLKVGKIEIARFGNYATKH